MTNSVSTLQMIPQTAAKTAANAPALSPRDIEATKDFEAVFVSEMLGHMFDGLNADPLFGGGHGEDMFRSMMVQEYGKKIAHGKGIGISEQMQKMIVSMQQIQNGG